MNTIILAQTAAALKVIENIRAGALRRFTQTVSLACCTVLFSNFSLAASIAGLHFMHKDWELACDNTGTCRAAGYQADEHLDRPVSVLLLRAAGANTSIAARLKIDAEHLAGQRKALTLYMQGKNYGKVKQAITDKTVAILPVHCYGIPCDVDSLQKIADQNNLKLIYDAAHAFGVKHQGKSLLNYGDLSVISFHATKVFNTFEGGAIVCHTAEMKQRIDRLKNFGIVNETAIDDISLNGKLSEVHAALGLLQLKTIDQTLLARKKVDALYREFLKGVDGLHIIERPALDLDNYSYFPIMISSHYPLSRDELFEKLKQNNIFARKYFHPLMTELKVYKQFASNTPNAKELSESVLCLPLYPTLSQDECKRITEVICSVAD